MEKSQVLTRDPVLPVSCKQGIRKSAFADKSLGMRFWLFMELLLLFSRAAEAAGAFTVSLIVHGDTERQENTLCKAVACGNR